MPFLHILKIRWWLSGIFGLFPLCADAQVQSLKEAAQQAVLSNPEVLSRWHAYEAASGERNAAAGAFLPRLDLSAGAGRDRFDQPTLKSNLNRNSTSLSLTQLLYDGFATSNDVKRLDYARRVRLYELFDITESATLEVVRAYLDVLRYRALLSLAEENYVRHKSVFDQIQRKAAAGVARRVDLEQASGRLALAESNLLTETSNLHDVSARFQRLVGAPPKKDLEMPAGLEKGIPADMLAALKDAYAQHPALLATIENVRSADKAAKMRNAAFQPRVDLRLRTDNGNNLSGIPGPTRNNVAEVVLSWNLFSGLSDMARVKQYAGQLNVARDQRDKTCRDLRQTLAIAYNDTRKLTEQLTYLDQHQLSIEKARDAYRKQFDIGQRTLLDVLDTENELFQAKRAYANAEYDLQTAYARVHAGIGTLFATLGLSRLPTESLPASGVDASDGAERCPLEAPELYVADKAALNARAQELVRESVQAGMAQGERTPFDETSPSAPGSPMALPPAAPSMRANQAPNSSDAGDGRGPDAATQKAVGDAFKAWLNAWASRSVDAYLNAYAPTFRPANGISHEEWIAQRKTALKRAGQIQLDISNLRIEMQGRNKAVTSFAQSYRSAIYQDTVTKTLEWEYINGRWLIVQEMVTALPRQ